MAYQPAAQLKAEYGKERETLKAHHEGERRLTKEHYAAKRSEFFGKATTALTDAKDMAVAAIVAAGTSGYDLLKAGYHSIGEGVIGVSIERHGELSALGGRQTGEVLDLTHTYTKKIDESIKGVNGHIGELRTEEAKIREELAEVTGAKWGARYEKLKLKVAKLTL